MTSIKLLTFLTFHAVTRTNQNVVSFETISKPAVK